MRDLAVGLAFALAGAAALAVRPAAAPAQGEDPAGLFGKSCAGCHAVPDPEIRTDRAWLDQVHRTS